MKYHTTIDCKRMLISDMTDLHLDATIEMYLTHLKAAQNIMKCQITETGNIDLVGSGISIRNLKKNAERRIAETMEILPSYVYEAVIRGRTLTEKLQELHGRKIASAYFEGNTALLTGGIDDDFDF
jgi:hypothetical protein